MKSWYQCECAVRKMQCSSATREHMTKRLRNNSSEQKHTHNAAHVGAMLPVATVARARPRANVIEIDIMPAAAARRIELNGNRLVRISGFVTGDTLLIRECETNRVQSCGRDTISFYMAPRNTASGCAVPLWHGVTRTTMRRTCECELLSVAFVSIRGASNRNGSTLRCVALSIRCTFHFSANANWNMCSPTKKNPANWTGDRTGGID